MTKTTVLGLSIALLVAGGVLAALCGTRPRPKAARVSPVVVQEASKTAAAAAAVLPRDGGVGRVEASAVDWPQVRRAPAGEVVSGDVPLAEWANRSPKQIVLDGFGGVPMEFSVESEQVSGFGKTLLARGVEFPALLAAVTVAGGQVGIVQSVPGTGEYDISVVNGRAAVFTAVRKPCGGQEPETPRFEASLLAVNRAAEPPRVAEDQAVHTADVLILYDANAVDWVTGTIGNPDPATYLRNRAANQIALCNAALAKSLVTTFRWRLVGCVPAGDYRGKGDIGADLSAFQYDAYQSYASARGDDFGADHVVVWVGHSTTFAGTASFGGQHSAVLAGTDFPILAHEMGHNLKCMHDRITDKTPTGNGYNYGWQTEATWGGGSFKIAIGDIMSYAVALPVFSTPDIRLDPRAELPWVALDPMGLVTPGVAADRPEAADCARTIREEAPALVQNRASPITHAPVVTAQTSASEVEEGGPLTISVGATGGGLMYQWRKNGNVIVGANSPAYAITTAATADSGTYDCVVTNILGSAATAPIAVGVTTGNIRKIPLAPAGGRLLDIAARAFVGTGGDQLIGGVVVAGGKAQLLIRAVGPGLQAQGIGHYLRDPKVDAYTVTGRKFASNDDWGDGTGGDAAAIAAAAQTAGAFALASGSKDACLLVTVDPGAYTFMVGGADGGTGVGLVEIYLVTDSGLPGYMIDLAARARSTGGGNALFGGVVVRGNTQVLVRGVGPGMKNQGISDFLPKPAMKIFNLQGSKVDEATDWSRTYSYSTASALFSRLGAFPLAAGSTDAISVMNLSDADPIRTFQIEDADNGSGVALVEVYLVQP